MTPAEFYVSSDALVHLQISIEYLSKSFRTIGKSLLNTLARALEQLAGCLALPAKVSSRGQSTTDRQYQRAKG